MTVLSSGDYNDARGVLRLPWKQTRAFPTSRGVFDNDKEEIPVKKTGQVLRRELLLPHQIIGDDRNDRIVD